MDDAKKIVENKMKKNVMCVNKWNEEKMIICLSTILFIYNII